MYARRLELWRYERRLARWRTDRVLIYGRSREFREIDGLLLFHNSSIEGTVSGLGESTDIGYLYGHLSPA